MLLIHNEACCLILATNTSYHIISDLFLWFWVQLNWNFKSQSVTRINGFPARACLEHLGEDFHECFPLHPIFLNYFLGDVTIPCLKICWNFQLQMLWFICAGPKILLDQSGEIDAANCYGNWSTWDCPYFVQDFQQQKLEMLSNRFDVFSQELADASTSCISGSSH